MHGWLREHDDPNRVSVRLSLIPLAPGPWREIRRCQGEALGLGLYFVFFYYFIYLYFISILFLFY